MKNIASHSAFRHLLAMLAGFLVCALVLFYTGDSDPLFAIGSGVGAVCMVYLTTYVPSLRQPKP